MVTYDQLWPPMITDDTYDTDGTEDTDDTDDDHLRTPMIIA